MRRSVFFASVAVALSLGFAPTAHAQDNPGGGGPQGGNQGGGNGGGGRRGGGRGGFNFVDQLKDLLQLSDDQVAKIQQIQDDMRAEMQKARDEMDQNGGDRSKMREMMQERMTKMREKVRELLNKDQQVKFDDWAKQMEERRNQFGGPGGGAFRRDPEQEAKARYDQAEKDLKLSSEEKAAVLPLVKSLLDARAAAQKNADKRKQDLAALVKAKPGATDAEKQELSAKLKELRKANEEDQGKVKQAQDALREVLTVDNEAKLVSIGVLD